MVQPEELRHGEDNARVPWQQGQSHKYQVEE